MYIFMPKSYTFIDFDSTRTTAVVWQTILPLFLTDTLSTRFVFIIKYFCVWMAAFSLLSGNLYWMILCLQGPQEGPRLRRLRASARGPWGQPRRVRGGKRQSILRGQRQQKLQVQSQKQGQGPQEINSQPYLYKSFIHAKTTFKFKMLFHHRLRSTLNHKS